MKGYFSIQETSYKWEVLEYRVNQYCIKDHIPGTERFGRSWVIPENANKSMNPRKDRSNRFHNSFIRVKRGNIRWQNRIQKNTVPFYM